MKKIRFFIGIVIVGMFAVGCVSTVKYSPDLTAENAAKLGLSSGFPTSETNVMGRLSIVEFNGESVDWIPPKWILIPAGTHNIRIRIELLVYMSYGYTSSGFSWDTNIPISVFSGEEYIIKCSPMDRNGNVTVQLFRRGSDTPSSSYNFHLNLR